MDEAIFRLLSGLFTIVGGIYGMLMAFRIIPRNPKDPEKYELWYEKFGLILKICSPIVILFGIYRLLPIFFG